MMRLAEMLRLMKMCWVMVLLVVLLLLLLLLLMVMVEDCHPLIIVV